MTWRIRIAVWILCLAMLPTALGAVEQVDIRSGLLSLSATDLSIPAGGMMLKVERIFVPGDGLDGSLGRHWQLNWDIRLAASASETLVLDAGRPMVFEDSARPNEKSGSDGSRLMLEESGAACLHRPDGRRIRFDQRGRLAAIEDRNGNRAVVEYNEKGRLSAIHGPEQTSMQVATNADGHVIRIWTAGGDVTYEYDGANLSAVSVNKSPPTRYAYGENGDLSRIERPTSGTVRLTWNDRHQVTCRSWADGSREYYTYDEKNLTTRHIDASGNITAIRRTPDGRREEITDPAGGRTVVTYGQNGQPEMVAGPAGCRSHFRYDAAGRLIEMTGCTSTTTFTYVEGSARYRRIRDAGGRQWDFTYDARGNLRTLQRDGSIVITRSYYPNGLLKSSAGQGHPEMTYTYDLAGNVRTASDPMGSTTEYTYDQRGNRISKIDPNGMATTWEYDAQNRVVRMTDPAGADTGYGYDAGGRLVEVAAPGDRITRYAYDSRGRLSAVTDPAGGITRYRYDPSGRLAAETDVAGEVYRYHYDALGRRAAETDPLGGKSAFRYDSFGRLIEETHPGGRTWHYTYSDAGLLLKAEDGQGFFLQHTYDRRGRRTAAVDAAGGKTRYRYDDQDRVIQISFPDGGTWAYEYDTHGRLAREKDNRGTDTRYAYDLAGRLTEERRSGGLRIRYRYDALGRLTGWEDSLGGGGGFRYNRRGGIAAARDATGATRRFTYDADGRLIESVDPLGRTARAAYTPAGDVAWMAFPGGDRIHFTYDSRGTLSAVTAPSGAEISLRYDAMGNLTSQTGPMGSTRRFVYDEASRLVSATDSNSRTTTFSYDAAGNLVEKRLADGTTVAYDYDPAGRLTAVDDKIFPVRYTYNSAGLLEEIHYPAIHRRLRYAYDTGGRLARVADGNGYAAAYAYNDEGMLSRITPGRGRPITFAYDGKGRRNAMVYPNGITLKRTYDVLDRPVEITYTDAENRPIAGWRYAYDAAGDIVRITDHNGDSIQYRYDDDGRLVEEQRTGADRRYSYLPGGNRGTLNAGGETVRYRYDAADRLVEAGDEKFQYDAAGNLLRRTGPKGATIYRYGSENQLIGARLPDGRDVRFGYAPTGERIWRRDPQGTVHFVTDGTHLLTELDEALTLQAAYLHGPGIDNPLVRRAAGETTYFHADHLGSIRALTDARGTLLAECQTDAFGIPLGPAAAASPFTYTGREYDTALGLYYYRQRYYDPTMGRFLTPDPMPDILNANRYTYAANSPLRYRDPWGLASVDAILAQIVLTPEDLSELAAMNISREVFLNRLVRPSIRLQQLENQVSQKWWGYQFNRRFVLRASKNDPITRLSLLKEHGITGPRAVQIVRDMFHRGIRSQRRALKLDGPPMAAPLRRPAPAVGSRRFPSTRGGTKPPTGFRAWEKGLATNRPLGRGGTVIDQRMEPLGGGAPRDPATRQVPGGVQPSSTGPSLLQDPTPAPASAPVAVQTRPGPAWNPRYQGPTGMNRSPDAMHWKIIPKNSKGEPASMTGQVRVPVIHLLVTTEQLLHCRESKTPLRECIADIIVANAAWAAVQKMAMASGSTKAVIVLQGAGIGLMYFKLFHDTARLLYHMSSWLAAEYERWDAEEQHRRFARTNLEARLDEDIQAMRRLIVDALEGPALTRQMACREIDDMISKAAEAEEAAVEAAQVFPQDRETTDAWQTAAEACEPASRMQARIEEILEQNRIALDRLQTALQKAADIAGSCRKKPDADKIRGWTVRAEKLGEEIDRQKEEARDLARKLAEMIPALAAAKAQYQSALAARDRIIQLAEAMPSAQALSEQVAAADGATKKLIEDGRRLDKKVDLLRKGYPDAATPEVERQFQQLKWLIYEYQSRGACKTLDGRQRFNTHAGRVVEIRLTMEKRLKPFLDRHEEIQDCPDAPPDPLIQAVIETKVESETLLAKAQELKIMADRCESAADIRNATVTLRRIRPLVESFAEIKVTQRPGERSCTAPEALRIKAGQEAILHIDYAVSAPPASTMSIRILPSVDGWIHWSDEKPEPLPLQPVEAQIRMGDRENQRMLRATIPINIPYPSRDENTSDATAPFDLRLAVFANQEKRYTMLVRDAFDVLGPGTDFNGTGDLDVSVMEADGQHAYPGKLRITVAGASTITKIFSGPTARMKLDAPADFEKIRLGAYKVRAEVLDDRDAYAGPRTGTAALTLFRWNPKDRHVSPWFSATVILGKGSKKPAFIQAMTPESEVPPQGPREWFIHVKLMDRKKKGIAGAQVFTASGALAAEDKGGGAYLIGPIRNIENRDRRTVDIIADISFHSPLSAPLGNRQRISVELEAQAHVHITVPFDITLAPAFMGVTGTGGGAPGSGGGSGEAAQTAPPRTPAPKGSGSGSAGAGKSSAGPTSGGRPSPEPEAAAGVGLGPPRGRDECIRLVCPMCGALLFSTTIDKECTDCIARNESRIQRCMEGYKDY